jgi:two-component system, chemotaxis family, CheB/CheR fusion protein
MNFSADESKLPTPAPAPASTQRSRFPIVGIGASAGGLDAVTELVRHLPPDIQASFVLVQHLDPGHESALTQILSRATSMPVSEATDNLPVEARHIYVIPPNRALSIGQGVLKLQPRSRVPAPLRTIDFFLEALARDQHECAIGVILSGTASDGTLGLCAIKEEGGITFAQDHSAAYESMPRNAIAAGCVDRVLPPAEIARELALIANHPSMVSAVSEGKAHTGDAKAEKPKSARPPSAEDSSLKKILRLLRNHGGVDFSLYKSGTLERRVMRRMVLGRIKTLEAYLDLIQNNPKELDALYSDALINVTSFFRNPEAFEALKQKVFPKILASPDREAIRAWIVGCSSGEEAYSVAIAFLEAADHCGAQRKLQIFATDLHDAALEKARAGLYPKGALQDLSPERLRRFFIEEVDGYRVQKTLRDMCIFARQNFTGDPPFSRMDFISCRNVLIYLGNQLQEKAIPIFHYALKPGGVLFLGASESIGSSTDLFEPTDKKHKIFVKRAVPTPLLRMHFTPAYLETSGVSSGKLRNGASQQDLNIFGEVDRVVLDRFSPPCVLVDEKLQILQFRGDTSVYLRPRAGRATLHLFKMTQESLNQPLRAMIRKCQTEDKPVRRAGLVVSDESSHRTLTLEVIPLRRLNEQFYLILFEAESVKEVAPSVAAPEGDERIIELQRQLSEAREEAQLIQQRYENAHESLQAFNEEIQSGNEELQSINEELETSKEELESTNEELITVNEEMASRNEELARLNNELKNLHLSINTGIVLVGRDLAIRSFTPLAAKTFNLLASDIGRPLTRIRNNLDCGNLDQLLTEVIEGMGPLEHEVQDKEGHWFSLRIRPFLTVDNRVDGAVLILVDIDLLKRSEEAIAANRDYAEGILSSTRYPLVVLNADMTVHTANAAFYRSLKLRPAETEGRSFCELSNGEWDFPELRQRLESILPKNDAFNDFEFTRDFARIGRRTMLLNARVLRTAEAGAPERILLAIDDITDSKGLESVRRSEGRYRRLFEAAKDGILIVDAHTQTITDANPAICELLGKTREELLGRQICEIGLLADKATVEKALDQLDEKGVFRGNDLQISTSISEPRHVELIGNLYVEEKSKVLQFNIRDVTDRVENARQLASARDAAESANRAKDKFLAALSHELRTPLTPVLIVASTMERSPNLPTDLQRAFAMIRKNIKLEARLIDDLLDITGIAQGKLRFQFRNLDLHPLIQESIEALRADIDKKEIQITLDLSAPEHHVLGDPVRLQQIFGNLLGNAMKFTPRLGQITVRSLNAGRNLHLEVADTGMGITEGELPRIFDEFVQGDEATSARFGGVGLGLFTADFLVRGHSGRIWAESAGRDKGATFHVELPLSTTPAPIPAAPAPSIPLAALRLLLVEDHHSTRKTLAQLLTQHGHTVSEAESIAQARTLAKANKFDIVICDLGLPDGLGYDLMPELRGQFSLRGIALSGYGMENDIQQSLEAGFSAHLTKPVELAALEEAIQRAVTAP